MRIHPVKKGETLWKLSERFGVSVRQIADANNLKGRQIHLLRIDQLLRIPSNDVPDTKLRLKFRGLDHKRITPSKIRAEYDGAVNDVTLDADGVLFLSILDHSKGLRIWISDLTEKFLPVLEKPTLPIGEWKVSIDSRKVAIKGNLQTKRGIPTSSRDQTKEAVIHNARNQNGSTALTQGRVASETPVKAIATIYVEDNLRLHQKE